jgi:hypothetical protein
MTIANIQQKVGPDYEKHYKEIFPNSIPWYERKRSKVNKKEHGHGKSRSGSPAVQSVGGR